MIMEQKITEDISCQAKQAVRKPPTRWLSAKKAYEERPIYVQAASHKPTSMMKEDNFTPITVLHFSETPV